MKVRMEIKDSRIDEGKAFRKCFSQRLFLKREKKRRIMIIEITDYAGTEEKLIQISDALEQIKNAAADLVYDMEEDSPAEDSLSDALESLDDAIDSINDAIDDLEEEELDLDGRMEEE